MNFNTDIFTQFDKKWALLTAGNKESFNTMTVSWGGMGTLWSKPVVTAYVRTSRYTHEFLDKEDYFTLSFYPEDYKRILIEMGSKSGRDIDKMNYEGLTAKEVGDTVTFAEAEVTLVCKKLFKQELAVDNIPKDIVDAFYTGDSAHDMYIGEVVEVITNE
ncbi:MAG: flavin reductase [Eubacterium sp.]|nr:flavin reductase [Eubacterium sp.]